MREDQSFKPLKPGTIHNLPQCDLNYVYVTRQIPPRLKIKEEEPPEDIFDAVERGPFIITGFMYINEKTQVQFARTSQKLVFIKLRNIHLYKIERVSNNSLLIWVIGQRALYAIQSVSDEYKDMYNIIMEKANIYSCLRSIRENETEKCIFTFPDYLKQISYALNEKELEVKNKIIKYSKFLFSMMLDDIILNWSESLFFRDLKQLCNDSFKLAELNKKKVEILRNEAIDTLKLTNGFMDCSAENHEKKSDNFIQLQRNFFNIDFSFRKTQDRILTYPFPRANAEGRKLYNDLKKALMHVPLKPEDLDIEMAAIFLGNDLNSVNDIREKIKTHAEGLIDFIKISKKWEKSILFKQLINITKGIDICFKKTDSMLFKNEHCQKLSLYNQKNNKINHDITLIKNIPRKRSISDLEESPLELKNNNNITRETDLTLRKEFLRRITDQLISELIDSQKCAKKYNLKIFIHNIIKNFKIPYEVILKFILGNIEYFISLTIQKHTEIYKDLRKMLAFKLYFSEDFGLKPTINKELKTLSTYNFSKSNLTGSIEDSYFKNEEKIKKKRYIEDDTYKSQDHQPSLKFEAVSTKNEILNLSNSEYKLSDIGLNSSKLNEISIDVKKSTEPSKEVISCNSHKSFFNIKSPSNNKQNKSNLDSIEKPVNLVKNNGNLYKNPPKLDTISKSSPNTNSQHKQLSNDTVDKLNCKMTPENLNFLVNKFANLEKNITTLSNSNKNDNKDINSNTKAESDLKSLNSDNPIATDDLSFKDFSKTQLDFDLIQPGRGKPMLQIIPLPSTQSTQNSKLSILFSEDISRNSEHCQQNNEMVRNFVGKLETITKIWESKLNETQL
ncbi:hypothetical protein PCANB_001983 [Pneumocystis canis]|nr:hypothetical protein PCANB_001983 [Pneumocystis canis]